MANRSTHLLVGAGAGGAASLHLARDQEHAFQLVETVGDLIGGAAGGGLPAPARACPEPGHRSVAHALAPSGAVVATFAPSLHRAQQHIREWAGRCRARYAGTSSTLEQILRGLAEVPCRLATGAMAGTAAGYALHLPLNAGSPMGPSLPA